MFPVSFSYGACARRDIARTLSIARPRTHLGADRHALVLVIRKNRSFQPFAPSQQGLERLAMRPAFVSSTSSTDRGDFAPGVQLTWLLSSFAMVSCVLTTSM